MGATLGCRAVRLLAFSDIHRDLDQARSIGARAREADVVVAAGDFGSIHRGVAELIDMLVVIETPTILIPGNNETEDELREACGGWKAATVLHGSGTEIDGVSFWGLGGGIPTTPWPWSYDLTEEEAEKALSSCPDDVDVLVLHSPPKGYLDGGRRSLGSEALLRGIERVQPPVAVCGHIHECAGEEATIGSTRLWNLGPEGIFIEV
jgi:Icc-related predicted phosphoesterase